MRCVGRGVLLLAAIALSSIAGAALASLPKRTMDAGAAAPASSSAPAASAAGRPALPPRQPATPTQREIRHWAAGCGSPQTAHPLYLVLDGKSAPEARREAAFAALVRCAQSGEVGAQNIVGSLYWMGNRLPGALVARNPSTAETYFSNAAVHGQILDMYKMAYAELQAGHVDAAMIWAILYAHYEPLTPVPAPKSHRMLAELLVRIDRGFNQKQLPDAIAHANAIIVKYDAGIRAYLGFLKSHAQRTPGWTSKRHDITLPYLQMAHPTPGPPYAGVTEFLVAYAPDGKAKAAWLLNSMPDSIAERVRAAVTIPRIPASTHQTLRFGVRSITYDEPRLGVELRN